MACSEAPLAPSALCKSASDCPIDHVCAQGECQTIFCRVDSECPSFFICNGGTCRDNRSGETRICRGDAECLEDEDCRQGHCYDDDLCGVEERPCSPGGADRDGDGRIDEEDNCVDNSNHDQLDFDEDGQGNACDSDDDGDGIFDDQDNCPEIANEDQRDQDLNRVGDICEPIIEADTDRDGINNNIDNCININNENQTDTDQDGLGDECDEQSQMFNYKIQGHVVQVKHRVQGERHILQGRIRLHQQQRSQGTESRLTPLTYP